MAYFCVALGLLAGALGGCGSPPRSTRLTAGDFDVTTNEMIASLAASDFLAGRGPDSPPINLVINKVQNLTHDSIPEPEQWMFVAKVANSMPIQDLSRRKNIRIVLTPEKVQMLRDEGFDVDSRPPLEPTHVMTATFLSARRGGRNREGMTDARSDLYSMEYSITDLQTRQRAWEDRFEFQRQARGLLID